MQICLTNVTYAREVKQSRFLLIEDVEIIAMDIVCS